MERQIDITVSGEAFSPRTTTFSGLAISVIVPRNATPAQYQVLHLRPQAATTSPETRVDYVRCLTRDKSGQFSNSPAEQATSDHIACSIMHVPSLDQTIRHPDVISCN